MNDTARTYVALRLLRAGNQEHEGLDLGGEHEANWTQQFPRHSFSFQNPLRQNYKHLKALETTLGVTPEHLHSVIVFVGSGRLKREMPSNVTRGTDFVPFVQSFQTPVFSEAQVEAMHEALLTGASGSDSGDAACPRATSQAAQ